MGGNDGQSFMDLAGWGRTGRQEPEAGRLWSGLSESSRQEMRELEKLTEA